MPFSTPARACGIDFGTSNSTVGWWRPDQPPLLPLEGDKETLPSVVFFNADENRVSYGRQGLNEYLEGDEGRLMRSMKSLLGSKLLDGRTEVQGRALPFRELLAYFIGELKRRGEAAAGRPFDQAVLGRPVYFVDDDPAADQLAEDTLARIARDQGLTEVSFQYEPIAAAFHYEQQLSGETLVLVADIGGGTSDFSLIRLSPERLRLTERRDDLLANGGVHIGGTDFDRQLSLAQVMPLLGYRSLLKRGLEMPASYYFNLATWHTINAVYSRSVQAELEQLHRDSQSPEKLERLLALIEDRAGHWLAVQVEGAKIDLSAAERTDLGLERLEPGLIQTIGREDFDLAMAPLLDRVGETVTSLLAQAGLKAEQVDSIFFTGGASGVPRLRQRIAELLPTAKAVEGDRFGSIGAGLAMEARRRYG